MGGSMTKVLPGLFVGSLENMNDHEEMMANCISHVLVVQTDEYEMEQSSGYRCLSVVIADDDASGLLKHIPLANDFIHGARVQHSGVLICSDSGMSTNIALVAAYLMSLYGLTRTEAVNALGGIKHGANPVQILQDQLDAFENSQPTMDASREITAQSERMRLQDKFGVWALFEEDMHQLHSAIQSRQSLSDFDLVQPPGGDSVPLRGEERRSSQPDSANRRATSLSNDHDSPSKHHEEDTVSSFVTETELFSVDPSLVNPEHQCAPWSVRHGRFAEGNDTDEPAEVGLELTADTLLEVGTKCAESDDVPGAIPMRITAVTGRSAMARSRAAARSFQAKAGTLSGRRSPVAYSLAMYPTMHPRRQ